MDHTAFPAFALLRWRADWRPALVKQTRNFHLHGWWADLPYYDMSVVTEFFLAYVGDNIYSHGFDLTTSVIETSKELGRWAFEHTCVFALITLISLISVVLNFLHPPRLPPSN